MKKWLKIFLIVFGLIILLIVAIIGVTVYQINQLKNIMQDTSIQASMEGLMAGDCTKLPVVEDKLKNIEDTLKSSCWNPIIKSQISKNSPNGKDLCLELTNPESDTKKFISIARNMCLTK